MNFDISRLDILTPSEAGRPMTVIHPGTGQPFRLDDETKTPLTITLRGRNSSIARATLREIGDQRAAIEGEGRVVTPESVDEWNTRYLVAMTVDWNFDGMDGQPFPCNAANAEKLWTDKRFVWLRGPALDFISRDGNFLGA